MHTLGPHTLYHGEALETMAMIPSRSVQLICTDLPYGTTQNKWDSVIPLGELWAAFNRLVAETGVIVLTCAQPFTSQLVLSNLKHFKYDIVWEKSLASGQLNVAHQPMRAHESILVFAPKRGVYNEQKTPGEPYSITRKGVYADGNYGDQKASKKENAGFRHARSVVRIPNPRIKNGHPTQKPVALTDMIVKTYSNPGDTVLDCCMGSGTTGVSTIALERRFIGIELHGPYYEDAIKRLEAAWSLKHAG